MSFSISFPELFGENFMSSKLMVTGYWGDWNGWRSKSEESLNLVVCPLDFRRFHPSFLLSKGIEGGRTKLVKLSKLWVVPQLLRLPKLSHLSKLYGSL